MRNSQQASEEVRAETLFERLKTMNRETAAILRDARSAGNHTVALHAIARAEKQIELEARLLGDLNDATKVAVGISVNAVRELDLSVFSLEELEQLERLSQKLHRVTPASLTRPG